MAGTSSAASPLPFDRFWKWLQDHPNCVIRMGGMEAMLFDHEDFHWDFFEDEEEGHAVAQLLKGKHLVAEMLLPRRDIVMVQSSLDLDNPQSGHWVFELMGTDAESGQGMYQVVMAHGFEQPGHMDLKH